jgi:pimeloyl-ACP methyl ester carboxylesterase
MNKGTWTISLLLVFLLAACAAGQRVDEKKTPIDAWTDNSPHKVGFVTVNGVRLHYLDWGGSGPVLILVHGYGQTPHVYDDLASAFTDRFRLIAYARRGHGQSDAKGPYDTATLTEDLHGLMDALGIAKAHLAGWSLGGNEITAMAGTYPERVDRIVYLDAAYDWADPLNKYPFDFSLPPSANQSLDGYRAYYGAMWYPGLADTRPLEAHIRSSVVICPIDGSVRLVPSDDVMSGIVVGMLAQRRDYTKVRSPALAIYAETMLDVHNGGQAQREKNLDAEEKVMVPFRAASIERIQRELPNVEILKVPGTHFDFLFTSRQKVVDAMRRFLGGSSPK